MKIESNIPGVIERLKRRPREIRAAFARAMEPKEWDQSLREEAKRTLWALAKQEEWSFVETFLQTVMVAPFTTGFFARMSNPLPPVLAMEDFMMAKGLQTQALKNGSGATLFSEFLNQFDQMMTDWVATEKRKDQRDWDKTDEEIGHFMGYLMLTPDGKLSPLECEAKQKLWPHLTDYIQRRQELKRLNADIINAWLLAVLAAWSSLVRREFPGKVRAFLGQLREELV